MLKLKKPPEFQDGRESARDDAMETLSREVTELVTIMRSLIQMPGDWLHTVRVKLNIWPSYVLSGRAVSADSL